MSKKLKVVITLIAVCLGLFFVGTKAYATTGTGINDTTRVRKKANTTSEVVAVIDKGEKIEIISEEDGWYKVEYKKGTDKIIGYIRNDLLEVEGKQETKKEEKKEEEKTENETEDKNDETENNEENVSEEVKVEETENKNDIVENAEIELKTEMDIQLLPVIFSCKTGKIPAKSKVTILEVVGNWTRVETENLEGWIPVSKLQNSEVSNNKEEKKEESKKEEKTETKIMYVNTVTLNVREKADTNSKILTQLNQNDEVIVIEAIDNTWSKVKSGKYEGYTASQYLSNKKVSDTTSRSAEDTRNSEEAKKKAEEAKKKAEEEAKKKAEEEAKKKAEEEAKKKSKNEAETNNKGQTNGNKYYIKINIAANVVNIYTQDEKGGYTVPYKAMICSTGTSTPAAGKKYSIPSGNAARGKWGLMVGGVYAQYYTRIYNAILFHSVPYKTKNKSNLEYWEYDKLGTKASAGCIRLTVQDAKWIYENISAGTKVEFYSDASNPGPLGKPTAKKISNEANNLRVWDPTDPDSNNPWKK